MSRMNQLINNAFPNSHQKEDRGSKNQIIDQGNENKRF